MSILATCGVGSHIKIRAFAAWVRWCLRDSWWEGPEGRWSALALRSWWQRSRASRSAPSWALQLAGRAWRRGPEDFKFVHWQWQIRGSGTCQCRGAAARLELPVGAAAGEGARARPPACSGPPTSLGCWRPRPPPGR